MEFKNYERFKIRFSRSAIRGQAELCSSIRLESWALKLHSFRNGSSSKWTPLFDNVRKFRKSIAHILWHFLSVLQLAHQINCFFAQTMTKYCRGFSDAQSVKCFNYCWMKITQGKVKSFFNIELKKKLQNRYRNKINCFTWNGITNQCLFKWLG